jgi:LemA protein
MTRGREKIMKKFLPIIIAVGVVALIGAALALWGMGRYNKLIALGQGIDKQWGQVENVLQRRNDLIPNLVNVVQAYAVQEQEVFIKVAEARSLWAKAVQGGTIADKIKADTAIKGALLNVMAVAEQYPDLKSNMNFLALQDELAGTENRIAVERMRYNESVQGYNTLAKSFPTNIFVGFFSLPKERDYFKAEEGAATAPAVKFTYPGVAVPGVPQQAAPIQAAPFPPAQVPTTQVPAAPAGEMQAMPAPQIAPPAPPTAPAAPTAAPAAPAVPTTGSTPTPPAAPVPTPSAPPIGLTPTPAAPVVPGTPLAPTTPAQPTPGTPLAPIKPSPANPSGEAAPQVPTLPAAPVVNTPPPAQY